jgi:hypothetical protein
MKHAFIALKVSIALWLVMSGGCQAPLVLDTRNKLDPPVYKLYEIELIGTRLFWNQVYTDQFGNVKSYDMRTLTEKAFNGSGTALRYVNRFSSVIGPTMFYNLIDLMNWTAAAAGVPYVNFQWTVRDTALLASISDLDNSGFASWGIDDGTAGFAQQRDLGGPAMCWVIDENIKAASTFNGTLDMLTYAVGTGCTITHELGHGRGITGDDASTNPPHGGTRSSTCIMRYAGRDVWNQHFCWNHEDYLYQQRW